MQVPQNNLLELIKYRLGRLNIGQVIVGLCVIGLSIWCLYNVTNIMDKYYKFETIISLENDPPNRTDFPGITICAPTIFRPKALADLYPDFKYILQQFSRKIKSIQLPESAEIAINDNYMNNSNIFRHYESKAFREHNASMIINKLSVRPEDILIECKFHPVKIRTFQLRGDTHHRWGSRDCSSIKPILESIYEGKKCFTYFSDLFETKNDDDDKQSPEDDDMGYKHADFLKESKGQMVFDLNPSMELQIKAIDNDIWSSFVNEPLLMTVHPPNILQNRRDFLFFQVSRSNAYDVSFTKKTTSLMPKPYNTMCIKYREEPKYQVDHIKTRDHCISVCIMNYLSTGKEDCANYYSVITESIFLNPQANNTICVHGKQNYTDYLDARSYCEKDCPSECTKFIYEIAGQVRSSLDNGCLKWYQIPFEDYGEINEEDRNVTSTEEGEDGEMMSETVDYFNLDSDDDDVQYQSVPITMNSGPYLKFRKYGHSTIQKRETFVPKQAPGEFFSSSSQFEFVPQSCNAHVTIRISPKPFTTVRHQQAITFEGFLGTIGGHIGIWLGLSLYKIIKFVVHFLYNILHRMVSKCSPKFAQPPK